MQLGLDLTDSIVRAVVVNQRGEVHARADQNRNVSSLAHALRETIGRVRDATHESIDAVGVAVPSPGARPPQELNALADEQLGGIRRVTVGSGIAAAIAETWCGTAQAMKDVVTFAIGEHVTAGLIVGGEVWTGAHGYAGSVSWLVLNPVEREDYRRLGALEAEVASAGIVRRMVWRIKSGDNSAIVDQAGGDLGRLTADLVFQGARSGDGVCVSVVRDTAKYVGMAISNLATVLDPQAVVLGGTLAQAGDIMLDAIRTECNRRLNPSQAERLQILLSTLGVDAVAIGAARAAALANQ
jgi:glucokinase